MYYLGTQQQQRNVGKTMNRTSGADRTGWQSIGVVSRIDEQVTLLGNSAVGPSPGNRRRGAMFPATRKSEPAQVFPPINMAPLIWRDLRWYWAELCVENASSALAGGLAWEFRSQHVTCLNCRLPQVHLVHIPTSTHTNTSISLQLHSINIGLLMLSYINPIFESLVFHMKENP